MRTYKPYILKEENKMKEIKNEEVTMEEMEVACVEEKKEGFLTKAKDGLKKHGKKVVVGTAVAAVGLIGYALGARLKNDSEDSYDYDPESFGDDVEVTEE